MTYKLHLKRLTTREFVFPFNAGLLLTGGFSLCDFFVEQRNMLSHQFTAVCCQLANLIFTVFAGIHRRQHFDNHQPVIQAVKINLIRSIGNTHRNNWNTCRNCSMKRTGFERQQATTTAARPFRNIQIEILRFLK